MDQYRFKPKTFYSIHPSDDVCGKWLGLWSKRDLLDSLICCKMFPELHYMDNDNLAYVLRINHQGCARMTKEDVQELYDFLLATPTVQENPLGHWQAIKDRNMREPNDYHSVIMTILKFGSKSRPRVR